MAPKLGTSVETKELSDLEEQLYSETESIWQKASDVAKYLLDLYFKPKSFERSGKIYEAFGVRRFKKFMFSGEYMNAFLRKSNPNHKLISDENSAKSWEMFTRANESVHLAGLTWFGYNMLNELADSDLDKAAVYLAVNVAVNIYPIMLQRYNRARIYKVLDRK